MLGRLYFETKKGFLMGTVTDEIYQTKISPAKQVLELWYIENRGLRLYFVLIIMTAISVLLPKYDISFVLKRDVRERLNDILD